MIKKASPLKWYHNHVGKGVKIKGEYELNGNKYFIVSSSYIIAEEDCYSDEEIREKKLDRITKMN